VVICRSGEELFADPEWVLPAEAGVGWQDLGRDHASALQFDLIILAKHSFKAVVHVPHPWLAYSEPATARGSYR